MKRTHLRRCALLIAALLLLCGCKTVTPPEVTDAPDTTATLNTLPPVTSAAPSDSETIPPVADTTEAATTAANTTATEPTESSPSTDDDIISRIWNSSFEIPLQYEYSDDNVSFGAYKFEGRNKFRVLGHRRNYGVATGFTIENGKIYGGDFYEYVTILEKWLDITITTYSFTEQRELELLTSGNVSENNVSTFKLEAYEGKRYYAEIDGVMFNVSATELILFPPGRTGSYTVPDGVTKIADGAFNYSKLSEVILPASVTDIGTAFEKAPNVKIVRSESK